MNIRTPTKYLSEYERSAFWLQHRSAIHPQSSKYKGVVPLCKSCLDWTFLFLYNIVQYAFFYHSKSTMAATGPARGELVPYMVDQ